MKNLCEDLGIDVLGPSEMFIDRTLVRHGVMRALM